VDEHRHQGPSFHLPYIKITNIRTSAAVKLGFSSGQAGFFIVPASTITESLSLVISNGYKCLPYLQLPAVAVLTHRRRLDRTGDLTVEPCTVMSGCIVNFYLALVKMLNTVPQCLRIAVQFCTADFQVKFL